VLLSRGIIAAFLIALALTPTAITSEGSTPAKTVMIISHAEDYDGSTPAAVTYLNDTRFRVLAWNYCFQPMRGWGQYFDLKTEEGWSDERFNAYLSLFTGRGFGNLLYVDVTECDHSCSSRWADSVLETDEGGLDLMSLNPECSWYGYLRDGMVGMTRRFGGQMRGFAIDRLDRCPTDQESRWAAQLLDEVKAESATPVVYVMNSLQDARHQGFLAGRAEFIGSDGVPVSNLDDWLSRYDALASYARVKTPYIVPQLDDATPEASEAAYRTVLQRCSFTFFDDRPLYLGMMERLFAA
jgi:hypothetical protein